MAYIISRKTRNFFYRVFMSVSKIVIVVGGIVAFSLLVFYFLGMIIAYFECSEFERGLNYRTLILWYRMKDIQASGYISSIVGATITALLKEITIFQSHYTRKQDRVLSFSKSEVEMVSIGLNKENNVFQATPYFQPCKGDVMIELKYREAFSTYYVAHPIVAYVILDIGEGRKIRFGEELKIYGTCQHVSADRTKFLLETKNSRLLRMYCLKTDMNRDCKLTLLLDVRWNNSLMPRYVRGLSALYIRENIELDYKKIKTKNKSDKFENKYNIKNIHHSYIYLVSARWIRSLWTKLYFTIEDIRVKIDNKRMQNADN